MTSGTFDRIDLRAIFVDLTDDQIALVRRHADQVEAVRSATDTSGWDWYAPHIRQEPLPVGSQLVVFSTELSLFAPTSDELGLELCLVRGPASSFLVTTQLDVECWCATDHQVHHVRWEEWMVGTANAFVDAFQAAAESIVVWAADSHDPREHRTAAGLPNPVER